MCKDQQLRWSRDGAGFVVWVSVALQNKDCDARSRLHFGWSGHTSFSWPWKQASRPLSNGIDDKARASLRARCAQMISAIRKADAQPRFAQYFIGNPDGAMTGNPMVIRLDGSVHTMGATSWQADSAGSSPLLGTIKEAEAQGTGKCQPAGAGKVRGTVVEKIRCTSPLMGEYSGTDTLWVDKASGLPRHHETSMRPMAGGVAWQYGRAVKAPTNVSSGGSMGFGAIQKGLPKVLGAATGGNKP
jgi:hypothetical protein